MTYATIRAERYAEEGSQLITYMDHILAMHAQKGCNMITVSVRGGKGRILLGISSITLSTPALKLSGRILLGISSTTPSTPALKLSGRILLGISSTTLSTPALKLSGRILLGISSTTPSTPALKLSGRILLGISSTTPSTPALKQRVKQKQQTHLSHPSPFVNMLLEAPLTRGNIKGQIADTNMDVPSFFRYANKLPVKNCIC